MIKEMNEPLLRQKEEKLDSENVRSIGSCLGLRRGKERLSGRRGVQGGFALLDCPGRFPSPTDRLGNIITRYRPARGRFGRMSWKVAPRGLRFLKIVTVNLQ